MKVYRYGLLAPTENAETVREQMRAAHRYRNTLTEIERGRRAAVRALYSAHDGLAALEATATQADAEAEAAIGAVREQRASTRSRSDTAEQRKAIVDAKSRRKEAVGQLRLGRTWLRETIAPEIDRINDLAAELRRSARAHCGVYWGTYLLIEDAAQAAAKAPMFDGREAHDPGWSRWTGEGRVGVQIQGGMPALAVFGQDSRVRISWTAERAKPSRKARPDDSRGQYWLHLRVGSEGRAPVWAVWPMVMHRPLPEGGMIKRATVSVRRRGPREEWSVEMTVDAPSAQRSCGTGAVAVDLGWRLMGDEIRVAAWMGEDGTAGELRLSKWMLGGFAKVEELRSIRDKHFNAARGALREWLRDREVPEWLRLRTTHLHAWRSAAQLAALAGAWRAVRFDDDAEAYDALERWRYHDYHLWQWESGQRTKNARARREVYRRCGAALAAKYNTVVLEDFDLRRLARRQPAEAEKRENETARYDRHLAATSELRLCLINAFTGRGGSPEKAPAINTTKTCHVCGSVERFDAAAYVHHVCRACGEMWDQDENAAANLLHWWCERGRDARDTATARKTGKESSDGNVRESRWARAKRLRIEKDGRTAAAREADAMCAE